VIFLTLVTTAPPTPKCRLCQSLILLSNTILPTQHTEKWVWIDILQPLKRSLKISRWDCLQKIRWLLSELRENISYSHNAKIPPSGKTWEFFERWFLGTEMYCMWSWWTTLCSTDWCFWSLMRQKRNVWGCKAPVLLQIDRLREMDLTQIRVDYTHPPCLQSALHNLKSSYASPSHLRSGGGGW